MDNWAFGTDFADPISDLADAPVEAPPELHADLAAYALMLGDDALVLAHRLSEWCSRAPDLEEDVAISNIALDLLGQARVLLVRAAAADPTLVPSLPAGSPVPAEDALAFFRDAETYRNARLVELPWGDFADVVVTVVLFATYRLALLQLLAGTRDPVLSALAAKGVREVTYHRDFAARWFLVLAGGTDESRRRLEGALSRRLPHLPELLQPHPVTTRLAAFGYAVASEDLTPEVYDVLDQLATRTGVELPHGNGFAGGTGRDGFHTEALSRLLGEMQVVARAHPRGRW